MRYWIIAFCLLPLAFAACSPNNIDEDKELGKFFADNKVTGTFGMFNNGSGRFTIYNLSRFTDSAYTPASTFKIVNSLIGLETGRVADTNTVITWDGINRGRPECNRDMSMADAFRISCPPWYQELARRIGKDTMQRWLDSLGYAQRYGKFSIDQNLDTFWLDNTAKVTADEQLGLVKKLYFDQLPFQKRSQRLVRGMMAWESNANYQLYYKTGRGSTEKGNQLGWIIGWIEENKHPYFFVLQVESPDKNIDMPAVRLGLLKQILQHYQFMEGRM
ncbi:MAG: penicillin-binding transpeptidase domain-containing protein [Candidatus Pseudobacter hemicellulosilyticus]|uniref:Beta-lactamase n=1 Tax=Candidatus Pseudobacter hemicellulosilyticus TaxID=3121375 RepID=A0AAJ6BI77_9BACT|nr:MAG: penicillin-binding transpeptidase domain-containing protein [Pseudobacter sp.]